MQSDKSKRKFSDIKDNIKNNIHFSDSCKNPLQRKIEKQAVNKKISTKEILQLCEKKLSLEEIADNLGISTVSVATYIERLLRKGESIDIDIYVSLKKRDEIEEAFLTLQTSSVKHIAEYLKDKVSIEEIRMVRGYLQNQQQFYT